MRNQIDRLNAIIEASKKLTSILDIDELLTVILEVAVQELEAERGTVFLLDNEGREIYSRFLKGGEVEEIRLALGQGIAGTVAEHGKPVRIDKPYEDPRFNPETDIKTGFKTHSILCLPIRNRHNTLGVIQLLNSKNSSFSEDDTQFLAALAAHMAIAIENAISLKREVEQERTRKEMELATQIQTSLLPEECPVYKNLILEKIFRPCYSIGGDIYNYFMLSNGNLGVVLADVSGKGIPAAMITSSLCAYWKALASEPLELRSFCDKLNNLLLDTIPLAAFSTMIFLEFDLENRMLNYCNCGHNPGLLQSDSKCTLLENTGVMLGMFKDYAYRVKTIPLKPGDRLLIYTDGLSEASYMDNEEINEFGLERIQELLKKVQSPGSLLAQIESEVQEFTRGEPLADDLTAIAIEIM